MLWHFFKLTDFKFFNLGKWFNILFYLSERLKKLLRRTNKINISHIAKYSICRTLYISSSSNPRSSSGKSPTETSLGFTNPPYFGGQEKYILPATLKDKSQILNITFDYCHPMNLRAPIWWHCQAKLHHTSY